ncbi:MAG: outer membrane protein insertion porin family, partial [Parvicella sp.]
YYTASGVSRGLYVRSRELNSSEISTAEYIANSIELGVTYKIPVSESNSFDFTVFAERVDLEETAETPPEFQQFITENSQSDNLGARVSFSKDTLNDFIFPTKGMSASVSLEASVPGSDVEFYKVNLAAANYLPLGKNLTFKSKIKIGYGGSYGNSSDSSLPFYKNYFAGGPSSVRGYRSRSLGPQDSGTTPQPTGGDRRIVTNLELLLPTYGSATSNDKRIGLFVDGGMVYGDGQDVDFDQMRYSAGILLHWYSGVGPLSLSYGVPLNSEVGDEDQKFQISLGTLFR